MQKNVTNLSTI
jgi:hypothetical protein